MAASRCDGVWAVCLRCQAGRHDEFPRARHRHEALRNSADIVAAIGRARAQTAPHGNPFATTLPPSQATTSNAFEAGIDHALPNPRLPVKIKYEKKCGQINP
ncbi:hypothetical protein TRVL_09337 [Trypanosoma vivax]|nr:hypothetical protein TRVL_09337 [Trypanosoma vivax]